MKMSKLALAAALAAVWTSLAPAAFANNHDDGDEEERIEIRTRVRREDLGGGRGGEGPRGRHEPDSEMKEKHEKIRELEQKLREVSKGLRQGSDAEKAAAKVEARKLLGEMFDAKLAMDASMLEKMEKRAAELKAKIAKKKTGREKAIEKRLDRMSGDDDDWN